MLAVPRISRVLLIGDEPRLLAELSSFLAQRNQYLPILDGPRMGRPDADNEVIRRKNAAARASPTYLVLAGLKPETAALFQDQLPPEQVFRVSNAQEIMGTTLYKRAAPQAVLEWGHERIGVGLLEALRQRKQIRIADRPSPQHAVRTQSGELVVCEEGNDLAQIIAANYAFSVGAGLALVPNVPVDDRERILERFYSAHDAREISTTEMLSGLRTELRSLSEPLDIREAHSITFFTHGLPWGFAYPEVPSSHLFTYPDLGIAVVHGLAAEQTDAPGIRVALLIDPGSVAAGEIGKAIDALRERAVFVSGMSDAGATVYRVSRMLERFPYDLLLISTHCGDAPGWRWTYEFVDSEGISRTLVTDLAIGVAGLPAEKDKLEVQQYFKFISFDGVDWNDKERKKNVYFGTAMKDWVEERSAKTLEPTKKEVIPRVLGSAALRMHDGNYLAALQSVADEKTPIVINNACSSWHELAQRFTFAGARAYVGTLTSVSDAEAEEVVSRLLGRHFGKPLAQALWQVQRDVYGDSVRRPYMMVGVGSQRLRTTAVDAPAYVIARMRRAHQDVLARAQAMADMDPKKPMALDYARFLAEEIKRMHAVWIKPRLTDRD